MHIGLKRMSPLRLAADLLILGGMALVGFLLWALGDGALYQHVQSAQFASEPVGGRVQGAIPESRPRAALPMTFLPILPKILPPDPMLIGSLEIPRLQFRVMMREGVDEATLRKAVGHLPSSALPGQLGNFVVLGHRDTFFRPLRDVERGDVIRVKTKGGVFAYVVESIQVVDPDWPAATESSDAICTLVTCFPFSYIGPAPRRFVVRAHISDAT